MKNLFLVLLILVIAGAAYYFFPKSSTVSEVATPTPVEIAVSDETLIKQALAEKYQKNISDVELTIGQTDGDFAKGTVNYAGEMGGGWWLAARQGGKWVIAQDGNGIVDCQSVTPFNFPTTMVPSCIDENGNLMNL